jgi:hypothetical protein
MIVRDIILTVKPIGKIFRISRRRINTTLSELLEEFPVPQLAACRSYTQATLKKQKPLIVVSVTLDELAPILCYLGTAQCSMYYGRHYGI